MWISVSAVNNQSPFRPCYGCFFPSLCHVSPPSSRVCNPVTVQSARLGFVSSLILINWVHKAARQHTLSSVINAQIHSFLFICVVRSFPSAQEMSLWSIGKLSSKPRRPFSGVSNAALTRLAATTRLTRSLFLPGSVKKNKQRLASVFFMQTKTYYWTNGRRVSSGKRNTTGIASASDCCDTERQHKQGRSKME